MYYTYTVHSSKLAHSSLGEDSLSFAYYRSLGVHSVHWGAGQGTTSKVKAEGRLPCDYERELYKYTNSKKQYNSNARLGSEQ